MECAGEKISQCLFCALIYACEWKAKRNLRDKSDFMQKKTTKAIFHSKWNVCWMQALRPEFKSFFHKSFCKTDYSIISMPRTHKYKWILQFYNQCSHGHTHTYRMAYGARSFIRLYRISVESFAEPTLHAAIFPAPIVVAMCSTKNHEKERKNEFEINTQWSLLLRFVRASDWKMCVIYHVAVSAK